MKLQVNKLLIFYRCGEFIHGNVLTTVLLVLSLSSLLLARRLKPAAIISGVVIGVIKIISSFNYILCVGV